MLIVCLMFSIRLLSVLTNDTSAPSDTAVCVSADIATCFSLGKKVIITVTVFKYKHVNTKVYINYNMACQLLVQMSFVT